LLPLAEVEPDELELGAGLFEREVSDKRAGLWRVIEFH
jgi:hypothetical protein